MQVWSLGREDPLEKDRAIHSGVPAWRIPWTEAPGGLQSMGLQRVGHDWECACACTHTQTTFRKILQMFQCQWVRIKLLPKRSYFLICSWKSNSGQWWNNCDVSSSFSPPLKRPCLNLGKGKLTVTDLPSHKYSKRELIWLSHSTTPPPPPSPSVKLEDTCWNYRNS